jgi:hypothetical protein
MWWFQGFAERHAWIQMDTQGAAGMISGIIGIVITIHDIE